MRPRQSWMIITMVLVWTALYLVALRSARSQTAPLPDEQATHVRNISVTFPQSELKVGTSPQMLSWSCLSLENC